MIPTFACDPFAFRLPITIMYDFVVIAHCLSGNMLWGYGCGFLSWPRCINFIGAGKITLILVL